MHPLVMQDYVRERHQRLVVDAETRRRARRRTRVRVQARLGRLLVAAGHRLAGRPGGRTCPPRVAPSST